MKKMTLHLTCSQCKSGVHVYPQKGGHQAQCDICQHVTELTCSEEMVQQNCLEQCPVCGRKDFYTQRDFNRKIGVALFVIAAVASLWTYGISFIVLLIADLILFKKLPQIVICYFCQTIFRNVANAADIAGYDHEKNDRIIYSGHQFKK